MTIPHSLAQFIFNYPLQEADVPIWYKDPDDDEVVTFLFQSAVDQNPYTITGFTLLAVDNQGNNVLSTLIGTSSYDSATGRVFVEVKAGVDKTNYLLKVEASSAENPNMVAALRIKVKALAV